MKTTYIEPSQKAGAALFSREIKGAVTMLNLLRLRDIADYSDNPELLAGDPISGRQAFQLYIEHTRPFLDKSGGKLLFLGEGGDYFIGPEDEHWDIVMLVQQNSLEDFLKFSSNDDYLSGIGHRTAAIIDSRLLPLVENG